VRQRQERIREREEGRERERDTVTETPGRAIFRISHVHVYILHSIQQCFNGFSGVLTS